MSEIIKKTHANLASRAIKLRILSVKLADSIRAGNFKSIYRGHGIEFSDVREYFAGDNVRAIDWNVTARTGKVFVRQYEEDKDLQVFFVIDKSFSMFQGFSQLKSTGKSKISVAAEVAALLLFACEHNSSSVGAVLFDGKIRFSRAPESNRKNIMTILSKIDEIVPETECGSVLKNALNGAEKFLKKRSLVFVISDFRSENWQDSLARLAVKNDVIAIRVTDFSDNEIPDAGTIFFVDPETKSALKIPTFSRAFKKKWRTENTKRIDLWKNFCVRNGISHLILSTDDDALSVLTNFFLRRRKR